MENDKASQPDFKALIEEWRSSGQTIRDFCEAKGIGQPQFYYHKKKIEGVRAVGNGVFRLDLPMREAGSGGYEISRNGTTIRLPAKFEVERVKSLLELLGK